MGATSAVARGLSGDEVQGIRNAVAAGRKPKVMFTEAAGQIAGQIGQVVELTDPALADEWVVVRFGRDELPFSPTDLTIAPRKSPRRAAKPAPPPAAEPAPAARPAPRPTAEPELKIVRDSPSRPKETSVTTVEDAPTTSPGAKPARRNAKAARSKGAAGLTVTLTYQDGQWSIGATQGNKSLAKPHVIKPAEALKMVACVDAPEVHEVVDQILAAERTEAEQQAEKLRAELAEVEARLAELKDAG